MPTYYTYRNNPALKGKPLRFAAGRGYYAGPPTTPAPARQPAMQPVLDTYAAQRAQARKDVNDQIALSLAGMRSATKAAQTQANNQAERAQGFALALAKMSENDPQLIADQYKAAAQGIKDIGGGLVGAVGAAQRTAADDIAAKVAEYTQGKGEVGGYSIPDLQNAAMMSGVVIPASDLAGQAASQYALAKARGASDAWQIGNIANQYRQKAIDAQSQLEAQRAELEATRPQLYSKALAATQEAALNERQVTNQERATQVQIGTLQLQQAKTAFDQAEAMTNITGRVYVVKNGKAVPTNQYAPGSTAGVAATRAATAAAGQAAQTARNTASILAANARNQATIDAAAARNQASIAAQKQIAAAKAQGKAISASQKATLLRGANSVGKDALDTLYEQILGNVPNSDARRDGESDEAYAARVKNVKAEFQRRLKSQARHAYWQVRGQVAPFLTTMGYSPKEIRNFALRIVHTRFPKAAPKKTSGTTTI